MPSLLAGLAAEFPEAGWRIRRFDNAAPQLQQSIGQLALFLTLGYAAFVTPSIVMGLGVFVAFIQAFIFSFLTMIYIGLALEEAH